ncbi:hypothetical protein HaLaN_28917 [Haematococcus lacustris]|uniref:Uncharacterized protein n=1 Tax=Haematococcus lacustris TaxID=44745 RepID=A0A6A0ABM2_HAELA|nr:hypothetical protein HaLaN_28917 [Haematococcus lacustris]
MSSAPAGSAQPTATPVRPSLGNRLSPSSERVEDRVEVAAASVQRSKAIPSPGLDVLKKQQHQETDPL